MDHLLREGRDKEAGDGDDGRESPQDTKAFNHVSFWPDLSPKISLTRLSA